MTIEVIDLSDSVRIRVEVDDSPENPRGDWFMVTGALTVNGERGTIDIEPVHAFPGDLAEAHDRLGSDDVVRWARIFHGIDVELINGTYWWADPATLAEAFGELTGAVLAGTYRIDGAPYGVTDIIDGERETYRQWADGDVYGVIVETRVGYVRADRAADAESDDVDLYQWEETESLWGCYLTGSYTARDVAAELGYPSA